MKFKIVITKMNKFIKVICD